MLSEKQAKVLADSNNWLNICDGAVRSGKTVGVNYRFLHFCNHGPKGNYLITGKTWTTIKRNILEPLSELIGSDLKYSAGSGECYIGKRKCHVCGANDERAEQKIRGMTVAGCLADEITLYPKSFWEQLLSRMSVDGSQLFGTTNPDSPFHWLKADYLDRTDLDLYYEHFRIEDNPFLTEKTIENIKSVNAGLWYKRNIEGLWVLADGVVYDMFDENIHVTEDIPKDLKNKLICIDYGISNPTAFLKLEWNSSDKIYVTDEFYYDYADTNKQKTDSELADELEEFSPDKNIEHIVDPSATSFIIELLKRGFNIRNAENTVLDGIRYVSGLLKTLSLVISEKCRNLIKEFATYIWDAKVQLKGETKPVKKNDHCLDSLRYGLYTKFGQGSPLW